MNNYVICRYWVNGKTYTTNEQVISRYPFNWKTYKNQWTIMWFLDIQSMEKHTQPMNKWFLDIESTGKSTTTNDQVISRYFSHLKNLEKSMNKWFLEIQATEKKLQQPTNKCLVRRHKYMHIYFILYVILPTNHCQHISLAIIAKRK